MENDELTNLRYSHFASVSAPKRITLVAADLVAQLKKRMESLYGKATAKRIPPLLRDRRLIGMDHDLTGPGVCL